MKHQLGLTTLVLCAVLLVGCGNDDRGSSPATTSGADLRPSSSVIQSTPREMPTVVNAPALPDKMGDEKAAVFAQNFLEQWVTFSPANLDPKGDWFASWEKQATSEFHQEMRIKADGLWSWTWNSESKTCCVEFPEPAVGKAGENEAAARVTLKRWVQPLFATAAELQKGAAKQETKTYIVRMKRDGDDLKVSSIEEAQPSTPLPEVH